MVGFDTELFYRGMYFNRIGADLWADMYMLGLWNAKAALPLGLGVRNTNIYTLFRFNPNVHVAK